MSWVIISLTCTRTCTHTRSGLQVVHRLARSLCCSLSTLQWEHIFTAERFLLLHLPHHPFSHHHHQFPLSPTNPMYTHTHTHTSATPSQSQHIKAMSEREIKCRARDAAALSTTIASAPEAAVGFWGMRLLGCFLRGKGLGCACVCTERCLAIKETQIFALTQKTTPPAATSSSSSFSSSSSPFCLVQSNGATLWKIGSGPPHTCAAHSGNASPKGWGRGSLMVAAVRPRNFQCARHPVMSFSKCIAACEMLTLNFRMDGWMGWMDPLQDDERNNQQSADIPLLSLA